MRLFTSLVSLQNQLTTKDDIVGLASIASGLLVTTKGKPLMVSGTDPSAMAMVEIDANLPCSNKRSLVDMESMRFTHLRWIGFSIKFRIQLITEQILTRDQWRRLLPINILKLRIRG